MYFTVPFEIMEEDEPAVIEAEEEETVKATPTEKEVSDCFYLGNHVLVQFFFTLD